jgi:hypothetical protein
MSCSGDATIAPQFKAFRAMVRYIDEYPELLHHPKEDRYPFARLAATCPQAQPLSRLVSLAPAPVGLGEPWKSASGAPARNLQ